jgi:Zn-dependent peptidase ImmA (M78 family)/transcriptional regulator with XRE-family HTH domain
VELNREILKLARESRGYSQKDLSVKLGIEQGTLSKIENEFLAVDGKLVDKICDVLNYPKQFFFQEKTVHLVQGHYRRKLSMPQKSLKKQLSKMTIVEWHLQKFFTSFDQLEYDIPSWDCVVDGSPELCASYVREYWRIPSGRIDNLTQILENNGIIIIPLELDEVDGFGIYSDVGSPVIFVNKNAPGDRYRHILAHELAHLIFHYGKKVDDDRDVEEEAHLFAGELLIPARDLLPNLARLNLEKLTQLKAYWKVSMQAIIVKAYKQMNAITKNQYQYLFKQMSYLGYRKSEPVFIPREKTTLIQEIVDLHLADLKYTKEELCRLLNINEWEFNDIYINTDRNLKLVQNKRAS